MWHFSRLLIGLSLTVLDSLLGAFSVRMPPAACLPKSFPVVRPRASLVIASLMSTSELSVQHVSLACC